MLFFIPELGNGGIEKVVITLGQRLKDIYDVYIYAEVQINPNFKGTRKNLTIIPTGSNPKVLKHKYFLQRALKFRSIIRKYRPDIIISAYPRVNAIAGLALKLSQPKPKWILSDHGDPSLYLGEKGIRRWLKRSLLRRMTGEAQACVAISNSVRVQMEEVYQCGQVKVLANPLDLQGISVLAKEPVSHPWFSESIPIIISVGRLTKSKDFETLIKAFKLVLGALNARLVILGDGSERNHLVQLAKELKLESKIWFAGYAPNPYKYVSRSTVFAFSSTSEGQGMVLLEAMALNIPIVTTGFEGVNDVISNQVSGLVVTVGDSNSLGNCLISLLESEGLRSELSGAACLTLEKHSLDHASGQYIQLIEEIV
ncbi:Glycosyltransferase involved in cell wall bisynthesis [Desulfosporosinus hippei DSM 8344]|uniref:Glycosyltransferase involved in cell wall bisynthesis n=1 Tax=Desulfosporosinus hippei DSM 8344 TaxID=1121419 RepID=A0A1G8H1C0_9FIRM|nr:Glycosyltransferase involved in cell wall bisynthesis [Desulfosporosinus hippei DSM 8344]